MWMKYASATDDHDHAEQQHEAGGGEERRTEPAGLDADLHLGLRQRDLVLDQRGDVAAGARDELADRRLLLRPVDRRQRRLGRVRCLSWVLPSRQPSLGDA